jgi:DNA-binding HxlR family transcriptional regulator
VKSYGHYCGLARALDVVGERWALLVVRELLEGPRRYRELLAGMPGVATNTLAERLDHLREAGVIAHLDDGRYALTPWGEGLREAVYALGRWAGPLMAGPRGGDAFRPQWIRHMAVARFDGHDPERRDLTVQIQVSAGDGETAEPWGLVSAGGRVHLVPGPIAAPDVSLRGPVEPTVGLLLGRISARTARERGVTTSGDVRRLPGLRPRGEAPRPTAAAR